MFRDAIYRCWSFWKHWLTAWNTGGEGIHSPYLFYLVRMLMYDQNAYYCWYEIEQRRYAMLHAPKMIHVDDYGVGQGQKAERLVMDIAKQSLERPKVAQLMFRWLRYMGENKKGLQVVELGTSLGITTAYLASAHSLNQVLTFEGSGEILAMAKMNFEKLGLSNIKTIEGNIDLTLENTLYNRARVVPNYKIDMAFMDANHTYEATMRYWNILKRYSHPQSIFIVDDIHYSRAMHKAWQEIKQQPEVTSTMDLYYVGIVFFDPQLIRRHYKLRY